MDIWQNEKLIKTLKNGGIAVMPTDTLYGVVGRAENKEVVEKIYAIRKRSPAKPCIILIGDIKELEKFSIDLSENQKKFFENLPPNPTSIILDCLDDKFEYLHRGTKTLAFRLPASQALKELLLKTGPLVAPSANLEGGIPATNIQEAKKYFGKLVDLYINAGEISGNPSRVIKLDKDGSVSILRG